MKTYTIKEQLISYEEVNENGITTYKPVKTELIAESQSWTKGAMQMIEMYSGNISPMGLWLDEKGRVKRCRITIDENKLLMKEILIERNNQ